MKKLAIALLTLAAIALPKGAIAEIIKAEVNGRQRLIITGLIPDTVVPNLVLNTDWKSSYKRFNECGITNFVVPEAATQFQYEILLKNIGPTVATAPTCATPIGEEQSVRVGNTVYFRYASAAGNSGQFLIPKPRARKANKCGFLSIIAPSGLTNVVLNGVNTNFFAKPVNPSPPICKKIGNSYVTYVKL